MFFVPSAVNRAQMWLVQPVCDTRGTHKETMRRQAAPGTPDGILMSGVSSPLSDSRSDALMPSKCTLPTFSYASKAAIPHVKPRDFIS